MVRTHAAEAFCRCKDQPGCLVLDGTRNCTDLNAQATREEMRQETKSSLKESFSKHSARDTGEMADYVLIAMTGLSGAARQGEKREVLIGAARRFAAAILQEESLDDKSTFKEAVANRRARFPPECGIS